MAINSLARARDHILKLQASTKRAREKAGEVMETAIETGETVGTAFAFGLWAGKVNDDKHFELAGIPIPLLVGLGAHGAALGAAWRVIFALSATAPCPRICLASAIGWAMNGASSRVVRQQSHRLHYPARCPALKLHMASLAPRFLICKALA